MGVVGDMVLRAFELGDKQDFEGMAEVQAEDCQLTMPGVSINGRAEAEPYYRTLWEAFPDGRHDIRKVIETPTTVVVEAFWSGHHSGPFRMPTGVLPPSGREVSFHLVSVNEPRDGKIRSVRVYYDTMEFLNGLGLLAPPDVDGDGQGDAAGLWKDG
jgi:predicted ester cyclase